MRTPLLVPLILAGCGWREIDAEKVCLDVGVAIASKTYTCTGDEALADARYQDFEASMTCLVGSTEGEDPWALYACHSAIRDLDCSYEVEYGDNLAAWLSQPGCADVVSVPGAYTPPEEE